MKILVYILFTLKLVNSELPPPYISRQFRPSAKLLSSPPRTTYGVPINSPIRQPQTVYGPPENLEPLDLFYRQPLGNSPRTTYGNPNNSPIRQPQTVYGPPENLEPLDPYYRQPLGNPTKYRIINRQQNSDYTTRLEQKIPQNIYGPPIKVNAIPPTQQQTSELNAQTLYGPPKLINPIPSQTYKQLTPQNQNNFYILPQAIYGAPTRENLQPEQQQEQRVPSQTYKPLAPQNQNQFFIPPQTIYGTPTRENLQLGQQQEQRVPSQTYKPLTTQNQNQFSIPPQTIYGAPTRENLHPEQQQQQRGVDASTIEEIRQLKKLIQKIEVQRLIQSRYASQAVSQLDFNNRHAQSLPNKVAGTFRFSPSQQYLPVKEPENFRKDVPLLYPSVNEPRFNTAENNLPTRGNQPELTTDYLPSQDSNNQFNSVTPRYLPNRPSGTTNSWNNLDFPNVKNNPNNVDIQKVEVTQFGSQTGNKNNINTTFRPESDRNEDKINNKYIPPVTTDNPIVRTSVTTTLGPLDSTTIDDNYPNNEEENTEAPNTAVATAVAGEPNDQQFYLLHPDGRYQRIIYPKNNENSQKNSLINPTYQLYQNLPYTPVYNVLVK